MNFNSLRKEIISNNASVKELVNDIFAKIDHKDPEINSYICTTKDNAIAQAENIDKLIQNKGKLPPGTLLISQGFEVTPNTEVSVELPIANSSKFVFPKQIPPEDHNLLEAVDS